ncbi:MAG: 6-bladed beta-propeller, partial [Gemmatimonadota bacterium]|nr:6-bladed beta-propeller [Gemmatimonadota bacterium]
MTPTHRARTSRTLTLLALGFAAAAGCGGEGVGRADVVIDTVAGLETVINLAEDDARPPAPFRLGETPVRIGRVEGDGPDVFGEVAALAVAEDRTIYVADGVALEIRVFGADGSFRFAFGGKGEGPGEFEHIDGLVIEPDGTLAVRDS